MKAYSYDLRIKMLEYATKHSIKETAKAFKVSPNTVFLLKKRYLETGDIKPLKRKSSYKRLITTDGEIFLEALLLTEPNLTLENLRDAYEEHYKIRVSKGTISNTLKRLNLT